jgi:hypothetical protein
MLWVLPVNDLSDSRLRQCYIEHCVKLMSMQKLFRHNADAQEVEQLVLKACFQLQALLEPHLTPEECDDLSLRLVYAQA